MDRLYFELSCKYLNISNSCFHFINESISRAVSAEFGEAHKLVSSARTILQLANIDNAYLIQSKKFAVGFKIFGGNYDKEDVARIDSLLPTVEDSYVVTSLLVFKSQLLFCLGLHKECKLH